MTTSTGTDHAAAVRAPSAAASQAPAHGGAVRFEHLRKAFGDVVALDGVSLAIERGETVALLGPNGAGKTTALEILLGLQRPTSGEVALLGRDPRCTVTDGGVGAMLQSGGLAGMLTVAEQLEMVAALYRQPVPLARMLESAGLAEFADRRVEKLSGGQKQRLRFALAAIGDPELLVLDEPTVAMDVETRRGFWASLRELTSQGRTVLFATHYLEEADAVADRIIVLHRGKVVADGPATQIRAAAGGRVFRFTLEAPDAAALAAIPATDDVEVHGKQVVIRSHDADAVVRHVVAAYPDARDFDVAGAGIEDAFLALTGD